MPSILVGLLPIKYNLQEYIDIKNPNNYRRGTRLYTLRCSYFYGKKDEILEGAKNVVIWHYNHAKINKGHGAPFLTRQWKKYAKISGFYKEIKRRYPKAFFRK